MKKIAYKSLALIMALVGCLVCSCSDFEPTALPDVPELAKVTDLRADVTGHNVELSWLLPAAEGIEGVRLILNGRSANPVDLEGKVTSYTIKGQPIAEEHIYTVKVVYEGGYISEGVTVAATLPEEQLAEVSNLKGNANGRTVTLSWTLPSENGITGVRVIRDGETDAATLLEGRATEAVLKGQPMDRTIKYTVQVVYDDFYASEGASIDVNIPYISPKIAYLMTAPSIDALPDDDERAAAKWFSEQPDAEFITPEQLADIDSDIYSVLWIEIDRVGLPLGWENLPEAFVSESTIAALKAYTANGGSLYLANMATQLTVPLGIVPDNMAPTVYGNGDGGSGDDVWVINPYLGWDFRNGSDQGFYDRTAHEIYKGLVLEDPNGYGYDNLPLIGPGQREDHNCLWDCNIYGRGNQPDVIKNFEVTTNCLVLATWGHVRDHCVAGLVEFYANAQHGRCIANGFAAYEWNQNSGVNPYQHNVEKLTSNILNYLK